MQRHKIVARIILLVISVINFALAAPVLVRGKREARADMVDVAEDVTTTLRKRWIPSDSWSTNGEDGANPPPSLASSDSFGEYRLDLDLKPPDPIDLDSTDSTRYSSLGSVDWDYAHPLGPPAPDWDNPHPLGSPPPAHKNLPLDIDLNVFPHSSPGLTDDQPPPAPPSDPGSSKRPYSPSDDPDPGPSKRPYNPSDPRPSTYGSGPGPSTWGLGLEPSTLGPEPLTWSLGPSDPGPSTLAYPPSGPGPSTRPYPSSHPGPSTRPYPPSGSGPSTSDPGPPTMPYPPSGPRPSTSDPGPSTLAYPTSGSAPSIRPPSSSGSLQHESGILFSELFRGSRFKRRISGSRSVNAAQRELQGNLESREYVSASAFPLPPTFQLP